MRLPAFIDRSWRVTSPHADPAKLPSSFWAARLQAALRCLKGQATIFGYDLQNFQGSIPPEGFSDGLTIGCRVNFRGPWSDPHGHTASPSNRVGS